MRLDKLFVVKSAQAQKSVYRIIRLDVEHILYSTSLEILVALGYFVTLKPITTSLACKEQHGLVHCCRIDVLGKVLLACACSL